MMDKKGRSRHEDAAPGGPAGRRGGGSAGDPEVAATAAGAGQRRGKARPARTGDSGVATGGRLRHPEDFRGRRARLAELMNRHGGGVAIAFTAPEVIRNRDAAYPYRPDSYFHYLSGFPEPEAAVVIVADGRESRSILFCRSRNVEREIWDGLRYGPAAAKKRFGFDEACPIEALDEQMPKLLADQPILFHAVASDEGLDARVRGWMSAVRAQSRAGIASPVCSFDLNHLLDEMRLFKDADEIAIMRDSATIAAEAHRRAMLRTGPGVLEYQIEAEILEVFHRYGAAAPAYGSIVAGGANACILHYRENDQRLKSGQLLLIDAGCELDGYASDITRTFPVDGRFTGPQRDLYELVLAAQRAAERKTRPGKRFDEAHEAAVAVLAQGMIDLKLLKGSLSGVIESGAYRRFYMHRTGHWLGRDVHDVGDYREPMQFGGGGARKAGKAGGRTDAAAKAAKAAAGKAAGRAAGKAGGRRAGKSAGRDATPVGRPWRRLEPGMVVPIEPGIYVRAADDVPAAFHDIGIRIEDDALVTADGCELITAAAPKTCDEIEALMRD